MSRRLWVVCFDVSESLARNRMGRLIEQYGVRVQESVFECFLSADEQRKLEGLLTELMDVGCDKLTFFPLCSWCQSDVFIFGKGERSGLPDLYVV